MSFGTVGDFPSPLPVIKLREWLGGGEEEGRQVLEQMFPRSINAFPKLRYVGYLMEGMYKLFLVNRVPGMVLLCRIRASNCHAGNREPFVYLT